MATRSTIAILETSGTVKQIYCHWDGDLEHNGRILKESYKTPDLVKELISLGDLSVLAENIHPTIKNHSFDEQQENVCVYYGRDRGDTDVEFLLFPSWDSFKCDRIIQEFNYLYVESEQQWYLLNDKAKRIEFLPELDTPTINLEARIKFFQQIVMLEDKITGEQFQIYCDAERGVIYTDEDTDDVAFTGITFFKNVADIDMDNYIFYQYQAVTTKDLLGIKNI